MADPDIRFEEYVTVKATPIKRDSFSISRFKETIASNGWFSRGNFFTISIDFSASLFSSDAISNDLKLWVNDRSKYMLGKSATLPAAKIESNQLKYFTRSVKIPGAREYDPFTITFINTTNNKFRNILLYWQSVFSSYSTNSRGIFGEFMPENPGFEGVPVSANIEDLTATITLTHYDVKGNQSALPYSLSGINDISGFASTFFKKEEHNAISSYLLIKAFPVNIGGLSYNYDNDDIQTFDVTFDYLEMNYVPFNLEK